jgi:hypothetical protein
VPLSKIACQLMRSPQRPALVGTRARCHMTVLLQLSGGKLQDENGPIESRRMHVNRREVIMLHMPEGAHRERYLDHVIPSTTTKPSVTRSRHGQAQDPPSGAAQRHARAGDSANAVLLAWNHPLEP